MSAVLNIDPMWAVRRRISALVERLDSVATAGRSTVSDFVALSDPFIALLDKLDAFLAAENYNGFTLRLDPNAREKARNYLQNAYNATVYPVPELTPDGEGGIDIEWENKGRHLALSIRPPGAEPDFISWREPQGRYEGAPATEELLNTRLEWLSNY